MKTVWKFNLPIKDEATISMPRFAQILHVAVQNSFDTSSIQIWALVNPEELAEQVSFKIAGTGHEIFNEEHLEYVGTAFVKSLVFHVFKRVK